MEQAEARYHCCATCRHFKVIKEAGKKVEYQCSRLGYQTKPNYQFTCWSPKEVVQEKMKRDEQSRKKAADEADLA